MIPDDNAAVRPAVGVVIFALTLLSAAIGSCVFDDSRLAARSCSAQACADGSVCCQGYCIAKSQCPDASLADLAPADLAPDIAPTGDRDKDGVKDDQDNCPDTKNPTQGDFDGDQVGDACDCAPSDKAFSKTVYDVGIYTSTDSFAAIDGANWRIFANLLEQQQVNGLQRASLSGVSDSEALWIEFSVRLLSVGDDGLSFDNSSANSPMAGAVLRTAQLGAERGVGYYCGIDYANLRLLLAKTRGNDLAQQSMTLFAEPFAPPGRPLKQSVLLETNYWITMSVSGSQISCRVRLPNQSHIEMSVTDTDLSVGGAALYTAGAVAQFGPVKVCVPK